MTQQSASGMSPVANSALMGAGAGSLAGLLATLFKKDRGLKDFIKNTLVGGGVGAVAGAGLGGLANTDSPASPSPSASKPRLNGRSAAFSGLLPVIGPAIYGATQSADGDKLANALKLSGASFAGGVPGGAAAHFAVGARNPGAYMLANLLTMAGSSYGTRLMADRINKSAASFLDTLNNGASALGAKVQQGAGSLTDYLGNMQVRPLDPAGGAMAGGLGGAAIGGLGGLLKAIFDGEDDGILGTLQKTLGGAAFGGVGGAALGGGYSAMRRSNLLAQTPEKNHSRIREIMSSYTTPLKSELSRATGGNPRTYDRDISRINNRAAISHMAAPSLVRYLEQRSNQPA